MFAQSEINARRSLGVLLGGPVGPSRELQSAPVVCALLRGSPEPYACLRAKLKLVASITALFRVGHHR